MEKKRPWFLDRYSEKNISFFFRYLGYSSLIFGPICLLIAIFDELKVTERLYWAVSGLYLFPLGLGIVLRKEWGRKATLAFPFVVIVAFGVLLLTEATFKDDVFSVLIIFMSLLIVTVILYLTLGRKYFSHPNVRNYFNR